MFYSKSNIVRFCAVLYGGVSMKPVPSKSSSRNGLIAVEFLIFSSLFVLMFAILLRHLFTLWMQIRTEDQAMMLAREAAGMYQDAGTIHFQDVFNGRGTAEIRWDQSNVWVRVELNDARAGAERFLPRETP